MAVKLMKYLPCYPAQRSQSPRAAPRSGAPSTGTTSVAGGRIASANLLAPSAAFPNKGHYRFLHDPYSMIQPGLGEVNVLFPFWIDRQTPHYKVCRVRFQFSYGPGELVAGSLLRSKILETGLCQSNSAIAFVQMQIPRETGVNL